ncbi:DUF6880 family protein [Roseinatronobacter sp.]|uniref:DUF6880 family protein n=1 Tax=Roseinatronobacter sp. TaxID=1945755 RepID=UPI0025D0B3DC|nr:DUF6880 family protein [Roseibaca sp.]
MSKKTLNKANLEKLGADKLAALVMELVQGNAALQRRARMELSAAQGPKDVAADLRKRFASLRRSTSYVDWRKQRALVKDLDSLVGMVETSIMPHDAQEGFELLWAFLQLAPSIHERTDNSNGAVGDVFRRAMDLIADLSPRITMDAKTLAERILDAVADAGYGEFDGVIPATAEALGPEGLEHLKQITVAWSEMPPTPEEIEAFQGFGLRTSPVDAVRRAKQSTCSIILANVADAQGDVDAYMARYSAEQLTYGTIAPDVAQRLLAAGRVQEAYEIIQNAMACEADSPFRRFSSDLDEVYEDCLARLGMLDDLRAHLWTRFEQHLSARALRKYLKLLPDFEDIEAEEKALDMVCDHPRLSLALSFLIHWPWLERASKLVLARAEALDGNDYMTLTEAAEALDARHPLAAALLRRAMILDTLSGAKSSRYRHAARHLAECASADVSISDYCDHIAHGQFVETLRAQHGRKYGFWGLVDG